MIQIKSLIKNSYFAGWSSLVARQAHNLKVLGSNPSPATNNSTFKALKNHKFVKKCY